MGRSDDAFGFKNIPITVLATSMSHALKGSTENSGARCVMELKRYIFVSCLL